MSFHKTFLYAKANWQENSCVTMDVEIIDDERLKTYHWEKYSERINCQRLHEVGAIK